MYEDDDDLIENTPIGKLLREHRERLGLTWNALAHRTTTLDSGYIKKVEAGIVPRISRRSVVLALTKALELDPWQTDEFLYVAGHAPVLDWQRVAYELMEELGHGGSFMDLTEPYYRALEGGTDAPTATTAAASE